MTIAYCRTCGAVSTPTTSPTHFSDCSLYDNRPIDELVARLEHISASGASIPPQDAAGLSRTIYSLAQLAGERP